MRGGLEERGRALEGAFFGKEDARAIAALRARAAEERLGRLTGIADPAILHWLHEQGVALETLVAFALAPMVAIAWADGDASTLERQQIHAELRSFGIQPGSPNAELLERWLEAPPDPALMDAWHAYAEALVWSLDPDMLANLADEIVRRCQHVAEIDGGVLRIGRHVSPAERKVLARVEAVFALA